MILSFPNEPLPYLAGNRQIDKIAAANARSNGHRSSFLSNGRKAVLLFVTVSVITPRNAM